MGRGFLFDLEADTRIHRPTYERNSIDVQRAPTKHLHRRYKSETKQRWRAIETCQAVSFSLLKSAHCQFNLCRSRTNWPKCCAAPIKVKPCLAAAVDTEKVSFASAVDLRSRGIDATCLDNLVVAKRIEHGEFFAHRAKSFR